MFGTLVKKMTTLKAGSGKRMVAFMMKTLMANLRDDNSCAMKRKRKQWQWIWRWKNERPNEALGRAWPIPPLLSRSRPAPEGGSRILKSEIANGSRPTGHLGSPISCWDT